MKIPKPMNYKFFFQFFLVYCNTRVTVFQECLFSNIQSDRTVSPKAESVTACNHFIMDGSPGDVSEEPVTYEKRKKGWRMSCDVDETTESLENEL